MKAGIIAGGLCILFIGACIGKSEFETNRQAKAAVAADATDTIDDDNPTKGMKLLLIAAQAKTQDAYETFSGKVQNTGSVPIPTGEITLYRFDAHGNDIGAVAGVLDVDPLPPGGVSPFKVMFAVNDAAVKFGLGFTTNGSQQDIPLTQAPNVALHLQ